MIYLADVAGSANGIAGVVMFASAFTAVGSGVGYLIMTSERHVYSWENAKDVSEGRASLRNSFLNVLKKTPLVASIAALLAIVTPDQNTLYAVAASQVGEQIVTSKTGEKAAKALDAWLDRQITPTQEVK